MKVVVVRGKSPLVSSRVHRHSGDTSELTCSSYIRYGHCYIATIPAWNSTNLVRRMKGGMGRPAFESLLVVRAARQDYPCLACDALLASVLDGTIRGLPSGLLHVTGECCELGDCSKIEPALLSCRNIVPAKHREISNVPYGE